MMNRENSFISGWDPVGSHLQPADLVSWERRDRVFPIIVSFSSLFSSLKTSLIG